MQVRYIDINDYIVTFSSYPDQFWLTFVHIDMRVVNLEFPHFKTQKDSDKEIKVDGKSPLRNEAKDTKSQAKRSSYVSPNRKSDLSHFSYNSKPHTSTLPTLPN